jgi:arylsulfatase A-like enzyme
MNVVLITLDQFRGDCLSVAGHRVVRTPNLDRLAASGTLLGRHYSQSAPCSPGRASLYTGTYQMNHRVVGNGTPLDDRLDNVARAAGRAGYRPALFGYTDQGIDPRLAEGPEDPRLSTYEGTLPGFEPALELVGAQQPWLAWLQDHGYVVTDGPAALRTEPERPAEHGISAFLTDAVLSWLGRQERPPTPTTPTRSTTRSRRPSGRCPRPEGWRRNRPRRTRPGCDACGPSTTG